MKALFSGTLPQSSTQPGLIADLNQSAHYFEG